ncbi:MAG TPA: hypothetical protein VL137_11990, partial [Polyangiaceae bacterium]|nr:hypothetical protein [Polyangiaceae bacterium]
SSFIVSISIIFSAFACSGQGAPPQLEHGFAALCGSGGSSGGSAGSGPNDAGGIKPTPTPDAQAALPHFDCQVALSKISYDSPGADAAEFLELRISGITESAGQRATLADCGLESVQLINGASAVCDVYRTIPVGALAVPADGYFVLCDASIQAALGVTCDLTAWDRSHLSAGWLQNGPNDGLLLQGPTPLLYAYEGTALGCAQAVDQEIPADTGDLINGLDDVVAACGNDFLRMSVQDAPLRGAALCPQSGAADAGASDASAATVAGATGASGSTGGAGAAAGGATATNPLPAPSSDDGGIPTSSALHVTGSASNPPTAHSSDAATAAAPLWQVKGANPDSGSIHPQAAPKLGSGCQVSKDSGFAASSSTALGLGWPLSLVLLRRRQRRS